MGQQQHPESEFFNKDLTLLLRSFLFSHLKAWLALQGTKFPKDKEMSWVLKAPLFTSFLKETSDAFPEATFVFTSRNPMNVIPSTAGMVEVAASLKADWSDEDELWKWIGKYILAGMYFLASNQSDWIKNNQKHKVLSLKYPETLADPLGTVKRIYAAAGRKFEGEAEEAMKKHLESNKQHKHGKAEYSLEKFGLSEARVKSTMSKYEKEFL